MGPWGKENVFNFFERIFCKAAASLFLGDADWTVSLSFGKRAHRGVTNVGSFFRKNVSVVNTTRHLKKKEQICTHLKKPQMCSKCPTAACTYYYGLTVHCGEGGRRKLTAWGRNMPCWPVDTQTGWRFWHNCCCCCCCCCCCVAKQQRKQVYAKNEYGSASVHLAVRKCCVRQSESYAFLFPKNIIVLISHFF